MKLQIASIVHARTRDVDFRADLLAAPEDFDDRKIQWARKLITDSTFDFDMCGRDGRRVVFCNGQHIVTGLSIRIGDLYRLCGRPTRYDKVNGTRTNYAFIGIVLHRKDFAEPFDVPYPVFLEVYEKHMMQRWEDSLKDPASLRHTPAPYGMKELPKAKGVMSITETPPKTVLPARPETRDRMAAGVLAMMRERKNLAFCSDLPNAAAVRKGGFQIVSMENVERIRESIAQGTAKAQPLQGVSAPAAAGRNGSYTELDELKKMIERSNNRTKRPSSKPYWMLPAVLGGVLAAISAILHKNAVFMTAGCVCLAIAAVMALVGLMKRKK